jgi:very-short-patch-repair endonuclease
MSLTDERHSHNRLRILARSLRHSATPAEAELWQLVRKHQLGAKFRRQHPIPATAYVVDFCAPSLSLIVELDGGAHDDAAHQRLDAVRAQQLRRLGYRLLRLPNDDVLEHPERVVERLRDLIAARQAVPA